MTHIHETRTIDAPVEDVWAIIGEFDTGPTRMAPGFVVECRLEAPDTRLVTFANGMTARERLIELDAEARSVTYSVIGGSSTPTRDRATMRVLPTADGRTTFVWTRDVLPDALGVPMAQAMVHGSDLVKATMEALSESPVRPS
ncbi:SRPBCC family protein [Embleya sp. NBC_00896]|uniref:SRPBCC family protein n=1 Tax=Embleya sp. NBC_00896 TaxID=2975961 RepID=UPI003868D2E7|nr:SRPBCC family protein [Embleya sp. NBC_00896]